MLRPATYQIQRVVVQYQTTADYSEPFFRLVVPIFAVVQRLTMPTGSMTDETTNCRSVTKKFYGVSFPADAPREESEYQTPHQ